MAADRQAGRQETRARVPSALYAFLASTVAAAVGWDEIRCAACGFVMSSLAHRVPEYGSNTRFRGAPPNQKSVANSANTIYGF